MSKLAKEQCILICNYLLEAADHNSEIDANYIGDRATDLMYMLTTGKPRISE